MLWSGYNVSLSLSFLPFLSLSFFPSLSLSLSLSPLSLSLSLLPFLSLSLSLSLLPPLPLSVPPTVVALDGDRETVGIEEMMAAIHFRIDDAAPPVNTTSIRWFFSSDLTTEVPDGPGVIDITMESILANGSMLSYSTDRRSLTISNISQSDEGRYFFMATNPAGSRSMHTDLIVHGQHQFACTHTQTLSLTHPLTHTHYTLTLTHTHSHTLSLTHTHSLTHSLSHTLTHTHTHSHSPTHSHTHTHSHTLTHTHSHTLTHTHSHTLTHSHTVLHYNHSCAGPPRIFQGPRDQTIIDALNVTFRCEALADPVHSVVWSFNSSSIITTNDTADTAKYSINRDRSIPLQFGSLTVSNVQYSDRGVYQCSAVNYVGSVSASATLTVQGE